MTKPTITRGRLEKIKSWRETYGAGSNVMLPAEEAEKLALIALAAMGSETAIADCDPEVYEKGVSVCLVAIPKETAEVICQNITAATGCKVDWHYFGGRVHIKALRVASQPAPVVLDEVTAEYCPALVKYDVTEVDEAWARGFNACRAAMLQASPVCTCPSGDGSLRWPCPVHPGNSPAQSYCCPAQNSVSPAQGGNSPATSDNWQVEAEKLAEMHGMSFVLFRHGEAPQCADPTKVVISFTDKGLGHDTLPAALQEGK
ncbi:hypothetical protein QZN18_20695 [Klebsiella variicola]|uniref:hypothetical protein n=1 Tax=Klebsiella variicola TaxID=244366 RepID=UPI00265E68E3|nr:hypothetical protein [Klebsiella variicola]WKL60404.1 hypothetical protein QZN18_20695 [Klebsiella variicola]